MKGIRIKPKCYTKQYIEEHGYIIPKSRELIIEREQGVEPSQDVIRFKVGDGITPYSKLKYVSSLYSIFPKIVFYDDNYENYVSLDLESEN